MFAVLGGIGGLIMGAICRYTNWPRPTLYSFAALPLALGLLGTGDPLSVEYSRIERSVVVDAPIEVVWQQLVDTPAITAQEMNEPMTERIGVPLPNSGRTELRGEERVRTSRWGKGVYFEEVIEDWQPPTHLRWRYRFLPDSFPRAALDDHVVIGGHYFDLIDTEFSLQPDAGRTRVTAVVRYRISTQFNFYADWAAQLLIGDLVEHGLQMYERRSEAVAQQSVGSRSDG